MDIEESIKLYFDLGLGHRDILSFLHHKEGCSISHRTLKRILRKNGWYRRKKYTNLNTIVEFIQEETKKSGQLHGYRWMHLKCIHEGFIVSRETIRLALKLIDPRGVEFRKKHRLRRRKYHNKGPNFLWHLDSYDKLKPYGICINGCVDGFSRNIIWLKAAQTNSDPRVIASYYYDAIKGLQGFPRCIRADNGTENGHIQKMQAFLQEQYFEQATSPPFLYGRSTANQRIESWWGILRKHHAQFWMNFFEIMKEDGNFDGGIIDKSILQFCFMKNIQDELDKVALEWNSHRISYQKNSNCPSGKPWIMYHLPHHYNTFDYLKPLSDDNGLNACKSECHFLDLPCDVIVYELCSIILNEKGLKRSADPFKNVHIYEVLRYEIKALLGVM